MSHEHRLIEAIDQVGSELLGASARRQATFAEEVGVDRSCLSRYEKETPGAPTKFLNHGLHTVAQQLEAEGASDAGLGKALTQIVPSTRSCR